MAEQDYPAKEAEYREHAAELLNLAQQAGTGQERGLLVQMAQAWLKLAERMKLLAGR